MDCFTADSMERMMTENFLCHSKCGMVNAVLMLTQLTREHLTNYDNVPKLAESSGMLKQFAFRLCVKSSAPLFSIHKVKEVSVSIPMDAMGNREIDGVSMEKLPSTIEIMLFDEDGNGNGSTHPLMRGSDIFRFSTVAHLLLFLDRLAVDKRQPLTDPDQDDQSTVSLDDL